MRRFIPRPARSHAKTNELGEGSFSRGRRRQTGCWCARSLSCLSARAMRSVRTSMTPRTCSMKSGSPSGIARAMRRTRSGKVVGVPDRVLSRWLRIQPRTVLMSCVLDVTSASRAVHADFQVRDTSLGMWTDGKSMRVETSLRIRASRRSVLTPRAPTPSDGTSVAGTTRTSCPNSRARSAILKASVDVSMTTRLGGRFFR